MAANTEKEKSNVSPVREIVEALIVFGLIFILTYTNVFSALNYLLTDSLYQKPRGVTSRIKIIAVDDRTLERYGRIDTWSRDIYADLINTLNTYDDAKPYVIAFDITFSGEAGEGDEIFAEAAKESGNVVLSSMFVYEERMLVGEDGLLYSPIKSITEPYDSLKEVTDQGFANVAMDADGKVRRIKLNEEYNGITYNMFPFEIYKKYCRAAGEPENHIITDIYGKTLINYSGKPGDYEAISLIDVLDGKVDCRTFKDSIVLVGAYASGMQDSFSVPNGGSEQMYGVEIHANILQAFMQGRMAVNADPLKPALVLGLIGALIYFFQRKAKLYLATIIMILSIVIECYAGCFINNKGYNINLVYFPIVCFVSYIYILASGYLLESMKRKRVLSAFRKYVAPEIVDEISKKGDFNIKLGGENRDIAVLFVDIRGFTTMSEALAPEQVVDILNRYLNLTTNAIFKNKGTLDKFVGDATMAVFNSPFDLDDYEFRAVCAAMDIVAGGEAIEEEFMEKYGKSVGFGVGVNVGPAVVGNVGCEFRMDFTAIGDTVNTAARLEANAKRGQVLISDVLYERIKDRVTVEPVGEIPLKGKSKGVFVYSVKEVKRD